MGFRVTKAKEGPLEVKREIRKLCLVEEQEEAERNGDVLPGSKGTDWVLQPKDF